VVPLALALDPDLRVLGFTVAATVLTGVLSGLLPAWRVARADPTGIVQQHSRKGSRGTTRLGKLLVSAQVALSLVLVIGAGLLARSLANLRSVDPGYRREGVLLMLLTQKPGGYHSLNRTAYYRELTERLSQLPGVGSVSLSQVLPVMPVDFKEPVSATRAVSSGPGPVDAPYYVVGPRFFETLGIALLTGRDFNQRDDEQAPRVAAVSQTLARRLFPSADAVGQHISVGTEPERQDLEIVGVVADVKPANPRNQKGPAVYLSFFQDQNNWPFVQVRSTGDPGALALAARREVEALGREYVLVTRTLAQEVDHLLLPERLMALLSGFFGALALLLAAIGLYGLVSYSVGQRTGEIGIRMALGAQQGDILWSMLREVFLMVSAGVALGLPASWAATRLVSGFLFRLRPNDPVTISSAILLLLAVAALAGYLPARRATRIDPVAALRQE
jgi:putative ABC transport system permease protein